MPEIQLKRVSPEDAPILASLARAIYRQHYLHLWETGGADWYLHEHAYAAMVLQNELEDEMQPCWFILEKERKIGYLKLRIQEDDALELERIYLYAAAAGKGIGHQLILFAEEQARLHHKTMITLKAMDSSVNAIRFYQKNGFMITGDVRLPFPLMKPQYRGMVILSRYL
jgi:GNAT superfamily N-acetyltransferase